MHRLTDKLKSRRPSDADVDKKLRVVVGSSKLELRSDMDSS